MRSISTQSSSKKVVMVSTAMILSMTLFASIIVSSVDKVTANHNLINHPSQEALDNIDDWIYDENQKQTWACAPGDIGCAIYGIGSPESDMCKYHKLCNSNENPDGTYNTDEFNQQTEELIVETDEYLNCLRSGSFPCY